MAYVFDAPPQTHLPVAGTEATFPVRRVYCIGQNYAEHVLEMGGTMERHSPFFFQKNPNNLTTDGKFPYPGKSNDVHFEVEMAVALKSGGTDIPVADALSHVFGYGVAIDMTRRDLQGQAKAKGRPWVTAKGFEKSAPIGLIHPAEAIGHPCSGRIALSVDGDIRQDGDLGQMIWKTPEIISVLSEFIELAAGDVILTGTPSGVGPVERGNTMVAEIAGLGSISVAVL